MARDREDRDWRTARLEAGLSLSELSRRTGINKGTLSAIETRRTNPMPFEARLILAALSEAKAA
jgi:transcriptional regulator with XRE-family HTH domain